jgi:hypothetical protein
MNVCRYSAAIMIFAVLSCIIPTNDNDSDDLFHLKFINTGSFPITALYVKSQSDTADWGPSLLPVDTLHNLEYVWLPGMKKGPEYAFRAIHDSMGTTMAFTYSGMWTSGPDTISAFSSMSVSGNGHGYNWGHQTWDGEIDRTP